MGLVRLLRPGSGLVAFVDPRRVRLVGSHPIDPDNLSILRMDGEDADFVVRGTPDEVHASLFPPPSPQVEVLSEHQVAEALDPATYAKEWENHSPNCARAMAWALGLVRARLGVGK